MRVDVDAPRIDREQRHIRGLPRLEQHVFVARTHGVTQQLVAHEPAVHERVLHIGRGARERRRREPAREREAGYLALEVARLLEKLLAAHRGDARLDLGAIAGPRQLEHRALTVRERERDVGAREREVAHDRIDVRALGFFGALKLAPRRRVEEEITDFDGGPVRMRRGPNLADRAAIAIHAPRVVVPGAARRDLQSRDRADARQCLAAKTEAHETFQIIEACDLAGRVPRQREGELILRDPPAVVCDADQPRAAGLDLDRDPARPGVERILDELLDDRRWPLDHLARGDLIDEL